MMDTLPKLNRLLPGTYLADELWERTPLRELRDYHQQVEDWNKKNPARSYTKGYVPEELRDAVKLTPSGTGSTEGESRWRDFIPPGTIVKMNSTEHNGAVDHDTPRTILMGSGRPSTLFHEAAHVDSLTGPLQTYFAGHRLYPGYSRLVGDVAKNLKNDYYDRGDYGGYEEDAARLRAAYAMSPAGTSFSDFFGDAVDDDTLRKGRYYDAVPNNSKLVERVYSLKDKESALKMLEHTLFPRMRFLEENKNGTSALQKIRTLVDTLKKPVGDWYERQLSRELE